MVTAIYPGTFDPITRGHVDIALRAANLFEQIIVAIAGGTGKETLFDIDERIHLAEGVFSDHDNIKVMFFDTLVTNFARSEKAKVIIRGIRAVSDFDYEFQMAGMNRQLLPDIETVFLTPAENLGFISSSLVREVASYGGDLAQFVDDEVEAALRARFID